MHGDQQAGLHAEDKGVGARIKQATLAGIHREECHVDGLAFQRNDGLLEVLIRLFDLLEGGFLPPMPEVQVTGVEELDALQVHQKGHTQVGGLKGADLHVFAHGVAVAGRHALAAGAHRHIVGNDVGHGEFLAPLEHLGIHMIRVLVAHKHHDLLEVLQFFRRDALGEGEFPMLASPIIEDQQRVIQRGGKTAVMIIGDIEQLLHGMSASLNGRKAPASGKDIY